MQRKQFREGRKAAQSSSTIMKCSLTRHPSQRKQLIASEMQLQVSWKQRKHLQVNLAKAAQGGSTLAKSSFKSVESSESSTCQRKQFNSANAINQFSNSNSIQRNAAQVSGK
jgi:hypothetical protein